MGIISHIHLGRRAIEVRGGHFNKHLVKVTER